jgi:hypothetical protein
MKKTLVLIWVLISFLTTSAAKYTSGGIFARKLTGTHNDNAYKYKLQYY